MEQLRAKKGFIIDMDGVIYHGNRLLPGAKEFVEWLYREKKEFLFLTNSSRYTPKELQKKLEWMGLDVDQSHFYTSALATAAFISTQTPEATAYAVGEHGLQNALYDDNYCYDHIVKATKFVNDGARLIGTNYDLTGPVEGGIVPACRALMAPIELATGKQAYYVGKPNALMMRTGLRILGVHSEDAAIIGDRMDTDIVAGIESGLDTVLVLSGVTAPGMIEEFPYRPRLVCNGIGDIAALGD